MNQRLSYDYDDRQMAITVFEQSKEVVKYIYKYNQVWPKYTKSLQLTTDFGQILFHQFNKFCLWALLLIHQSPKSFFAEEVLQNHSRPEVFTLSDQYHNESALYTRLQFLIRNYDKLWIIDMLFPSISTCMKFCKKKTSDSM